MMRYGDGSDSCGTRLLDTKCGGLGNRTVMSHFLEVVGAGAMHFCQARTQQTELLLYGQHNACIRAL